MIYCNGKRGKSKKPLKLSIGTVFGNVVLHVWEEGQITHSFYSDRVFLEAMANEANLALRLMQERAAQGK